MLIDKLLKNFIDFKVKSQSDTLSNYNLVFEITSLPGMEIFYNIERALKEYPVRDLFDMCIKSSEDDYFNIRIKDGVLQYTGPDYIVKKDNDNISEILKEFNGLRVEGDKLEIKIKIEKCYKNGIISIYSLDNFINWMTQRDIYGVMKLISSIYKYSDKLTFISYDKEVRIITETFQIITGKRIAENHLIDRNNILKSRIDVTNIQKIELDIIPEDFNIIEYEYKSKTLENIFNGIRDLLSVIYISDMSIIEENSSNFRIDGYRSSEFAIDYKEFEDRTKNDYIYQIYKWMYNDGNLIDKSTIARNIVSLHCRYEHILDLDIETFNSIETNYTYYLKTNTDEYLEEKKNLTISIIEEGKLLSEALYDFINNVGKNLLAYFAFLATLVVSTTLSDGKFNDIFTHEIVQIIALIILGSSFFLIFSYKEASYKKTRVQDYIEDLISGYGLMLGNDNVREIINGVKSYKNVEKSFRRKQILITVLWIIFNILLFLALDWLSGDIKILSFIDIIKQK